PLAYSSENRVNKAAEAPAFKQTTYPSRVFPVEGSTPRTILLVDDSEPSVIQIKDILAESGHSILVARNGDEALRVIDETIPDAMILDLMMPGKDGFEVLRTLRNNETTFHIPVLILTAKHITKEELSFLKRNNIHQLIQKGDVNRVELVSAVATMITPKTAGALKLQAEPIPIIGKPVVLVIEDNPDNMVTVRALLADNCSVLEATDGVEGIAMAGRHKPNLILMDIALPGVDGIQAFKTIRTNPHLYQIPVIALTASAMITDRETILSHGFDGYLAKPIEEKLFFEMINSILYGR
ncbi:MAG: response regulator, partial [Bacteroidota bacterium]